MLPVDSMIGAINSLLKEERESLQLARESGAQTGLDKICQLSVRFHDGHRLFLLFPGFGFEKRVDFDSRASLHPL